MSEEIQKYLENLGFSYSESKALSSAKRSELVSKIANHTKAGKNFERKTYNVEKDMKSKGIYYKC